MAGKGNRGSEWLLIGAMMVRIASLTVLVVHTGAKHLRCDAARGSPAVVSGELPHPGALWARTAGAPRQTPGAPSPSTALSRGAVRGLAGGPVGDRRCGKREDVKAKRRAA